MSDNPFPHLIADTAGWPLMHLPWGETGHVTLGIQKDENNPDVPLIDVLTSVEHVRVRINGTDYCESDQSDG